MCDYSPRNSAFDELNFLSKCRLVDAKCRTSKKPLPSPRLLIKFTTTNSLSLIGAFISFAIGSSREKNSQNARARK
jgi:hypothetical protein